MNTPNPESFKPSSAVSAAPVAPTADATFHGPAPVEASMPKAVVAGLIAAVVGAAIWAVVTVTTEYQIGWMAVGVGFLVGLAVGKAGRGSTPAFGILGAGLALFGCLLGNLLSVLGFIGSAENLSFGEVLQVLNYSAIPSIMIETASPMDFLFYAIAIYEGYKFSIRR